ncbi:MAG TPA: hypothetical protein VFL36_05210 [Myxococcales bacterium]|nr:hypothetical protein [Myxococcales bacterium]
MAQRSFGSAKRNRQYEKIKRSAKARGRSTSTAKRIAAATTNKARRKKGETRGSSRSRQRTGSRSRSRAQKRAAGLKGGRASARKRSRR